MQAMAANIKDVGQGAQELMDNQLCNQIKPDEVPRFTMPTML